MKNTLLALLFFVIAAGIAFFFDLFGFQGEYDESAFSHPTTLQIASGVVSVNSRNAGSGQELFEGDVITTNAETDASIVFFDDSISRLDSATTLTITELDDEQYYDGGGSIQLTLENGEVWSKIQKQTGEDFNFGVGTRRVNATIRGSALNVSYDGVTTSVQAAEHTATITALNEDGSVLDTTPLVEGEQVVLNNAFFLVVEEDDQDEDAVGVRRLANNVVVLTETDKKDGWFANNETKDSRYIQSVETKRKELLTAQVGALPGTVGYKVKELKDALDLRLASDDEKIALKLQVAGRSLAEATLVAEEGNTNVLNAQVKKATQLLEGVYASTADERVQKEVQQAIQRGKIKVRNALPVDGAYAMKEALREVEVLTASPEKVEALKEKHLERRVLDVYDLQKKVPTEQRINSFKEALKEELKSSSRSDVHNAYLEATAEKSPANVAEEKEIEEQQALETAKESEEDAVSTTPTPRVTTPVVPVVPVAPAPTEVEPETAPAQTPPGIFIETGIRSNQ